MGDRCIVGLWVICIVGKLGRCRRCQNDVYTSLEDHLLSQRRFVGCYLWWSCPMTSVTLHLVKKSQFRGQELWDLIISIRFGRNRTYGAKRSYIQCPLLQCPEFSPYFNWAKNNLIKWLSRSNFTQSDTHRQEPDEDEDPLVEEDDVTKKESYWTYEWLMDPLVRSIILRGQSRMGAKWLSTLIVNQTQRESRMKTVYQTLETCKNLLYKKPQAASPNWFPVHKQHLCIHQQWFLMANRDDSAADWNQWIQAQGQQHWPTNLWTSLKKDPGQ